MSIFSGVLFAVVRRNSGFDFAGSLSAFEFMQRGRQDFNGVFSGTAVNAIRCAGYQSVTSDGYADGSGRIICAFDYVDFHR
jgi:hypothetical protein